MISLIRLSLFSITLYDVYIYLYEFIFEGFRDVVTNVLIFDIVLSEFKLHSHYITFFQTCTLGERYERLYSSIYE